MRDFAEPNSDIVWGAYGKRWAENWLSTETYYEPYDQISRVIGMLKEDPTTRRAVIAMWDAYQDLTAVRNDLPCNTHIYFRVTHGKLDMTVCNRSNDLIWGMLGANAVHMTYLHELVAHEVGIPMGRYHVMTNNLHVYEHHWDLRPFGSFDYYAEKTDVVPFPLLQESETWEMLRYDCQWFVHMAMPDRTPPQMRFTKPLQTTWMKEVVTPLLEAYRDRKEGGDGLKLIEQCAASDWRLACQMYVENKDG